MSEPSELPGQSSDAGSPSPSPEVLQAIEGAVARLRAEVDGTTDDARRARLLGEIGEIEERAGDEAGAGRDYRAAYNADPDFREPLEGLLRLFLRRRSKDDLAKIADSIVTTAATADERARAL